MSLIHLDGLTKVFYNRHRDACARRCISTREGYAPAGPSGCGKSASHPGFCIRHQQRVPNGTPVAQINAAQRAHPQQGSRLHLPEFQSSRPDGRRLVDAHLPRMPSRTKTRVQKRRARGHVASDQHYPAQSGQQQRVAVARAIVGTPSSGRRAHRQPRLAQRRGRDDACASWQGATHPCMVTRPALRPRRLYCSPGSTAASSKRSASPSSSES